MSELAVGQTVQLTDGRIAIVRYIGDTLFAPGEWVGVELEGNDGKNDGSVQGERYFECSMGKGMFLRPAAATVIAQAPAPKAAPVAKKPARPSSVGGAGLGRRTSVVTDSAAGKRMSMNAASPSPATRSRPSSMLRVSSIYIFVRMIDSNQPHSHQRNLLRSNYLPAHQPRLHLELGLLLM
jgi:dynactin 1